MGVPRPCLPTEAVAIRAAHDRAVGTPAVVRNAVASLGVVCFVAVVGLGLPALDRTVAGLRPLPAGVPYQVVDSVAVMPPTGARLDAGVTRPGRDRGTASFVHGAVRMQVVVRPYTRSLPEATAGLREKIRRTPGLRLVAEDASGAAVVPATQDGGRYVGPGVHGRYRAALCTGVAVELTVRGPADEMARLSEALDISLASVVCRRPQ
ncbi:MAG TPA: hypothetical protein VK453_13815 [Micromonosporaceae bacterium]|nr:hypothetical protein [Micromonosporaceae bacterium]